MPREATRIDRPKRKYAPRLPPAERRAQLLDAAFELLRDSELHELSMEAVAQRAGVGKPVLYTVFGSRAELVAALLDRERERGIEQVRATMPTDLSAIGPAASYTATVSAFVKVVLDNPTRWRLILMVPDSAPGEYREGLRTSRGAILAQAEALARMGALLEPRLAGLDPVLVAHTMLTFAEMLGRLAVGDPESFTDERLSGYANAAMALVAGIPADAPTP
ncbi:DNA-binding transcriptional regulator, AcrR family [Rhodococcus triatomae]|uniref:DNA-binding transcriptional regulator, AcrR family n=1 Tax=Rhodococcus triatomae TaxID=300028 RepID=A0A1G8IFR2_9NOCA|nr:TetR/AcrR family transcriptional regulator [Rhodococcus triatomae]SDI17380.1 DNA-binding transcriptional regulator, AcrR family [Rhodococcus triatomae]